MKKYLAILILVIPVVASGCAGCQPGGSGSQRSDWTPVGGFQPANGPGYMDGEPMDGRRKHNRNSLAEAGLEPARGINPTGF